MQIYYTGKYQSLGIKQGGPSAGKWVELPVTKSPKIVQFSVGHDGSHALLVAEDGSVFFTGSASKGEDGESSMTFILVLHNWSEMMIVLLGCCTQLVNLLLSWLVFSKEQETTKALQTQKDDQTRDQDRGVHRLQQRQQQYCH